MLIKISRPQYYEILKVEKDVSESELKKAYYNLARENHPDKVEESKKEEACKIFQTISEAYEILSDPHKRKAYDLSQFYTPKPNPPPKPKIAEVSGKVVYINTKNKSLFHIFTENSGRKIRCTYEGFLPIKKGDAIFGVAEYTIHRKEETLKFIKPPFVVIGSDKNTIIENIALALRGTGYSSSKGEKIYSVLESEGEDIFQTIQNIALHYNYEPLSYDPHKIFSRICDIKQFTRLAKYWYKNIILRNLYLLGLNNKEIKYSKCNPQKLYDKCIQNPYAIKSISLEKCDQILEKIGKKVDDKFKECGKIIRKISEMMDNNGWTGIPNKTILRIFPKFQDYISILKNEFDVQFDMYTVYLSYPYEVETQMIDFVQDLLNKPPIFVINEKTIEYTRKDITENQKKAVINSLNNNISIITGGGGSGKSTTINEIVHNLERNGISYRIASFTGKAVARIREVTKKKEPATLHMMISSSRKEQKDNFKCLILDEASMITTELLYEFKKCFSHDYKIIFVGDVNQLPPIGWGSIFESLIESKTIPTTILKTIHRTDEKENNGILINSKRIVLFKDPEYNGPEFSFEITSNFKIFQGSLDLVQKLLETLNNNGIPSEKIVVISPFNRDLGLINNNCSRLYNELSRNVTDYRGNLWRIGDRVMMTENNYSHNVMNGSEGLIIDVDVNDITVKFSENSLKFQICNVLEDEEGEKELNTKSLILSYAVSVHRYQGSEIDYVIGYIPEGSLNSSFLNSNLMYTLITRCKKMIWLIGDIETMERCAITKPSWRCSNFTKRLKID